MKEYQLVFEEHFDGEGEPNPDIWNHQVGEKWANNESQCYVNDRTHSYIKDSKLHIVATYEDIPMCPYKSARLNTSEKKEFMYGKFVVRAKMPKGRGSWPAIWFLGTRKNQERWPRCGEIDLLEYAGNRMHMVSCAIHTEAYNHKINTQVNKRTMLETASDEFHTYTLDWSEDTLIFYVDEQEVLRVQKKLGDTISEWPFDQPFYIIINLAVGGWYGGSIVSEDLPYHLEVDYIKVYQEK